MEKFHTKVTNLQWMLFLNFLKMIIFTTVINDYHAFDPFPEEFIFSIIFCIVSSVAYGIIYALNTDKSKINTFKKVTVLVFLTFIPILIFTYLSTLISFSIIAFIITVSIFYLLDFILVYYLFYRFNIFKSTDKTNKAVNYFDKFSIVISNITSIFTISYILALFLLRNWDIVRFDTYTIEFRFDLYYLFDTIVVYYLLAVIFIILLCIIILSIDLIILKLKRSEVFIFRKKMTITHAFFLLCFIIVNLIEGFYVNL